jgi:hypothetical protein
MKIIVGAIIAAAAICVAYLAGTGRALPFGKTAGSAVWWVLGLGMAACGVAGIGDVVARAGGDWLSPWVLAGIVLGVAILGAAFAAVKGVQVGAIASQAQWMLVIAGLIATKLAVASVQALTVPSGG